MQRLFEEVQNINTEQVIQDIKERSQPEEPFAAEDIEEVILMAVSKRLRTLSSLEFYHNAVQIRADIIAFTQSEAIPKSLRGVFSNPMCNTIREAVHKINMGSAIIPSNKDLAKKRKQCYFEALCLISQIQEDLQVLAAHQKRYGITKVNIRKIYEIAEKCTKEIVLLTAARKKVKIIDK